MPMAIDALSIRRTTRIRSGINRNECTRCGCYYISSSRADTSLVQHIVCHDFKRLRAAAFITEATDMPPYPLPHTISYTYESYILFSHQWPAWQSDFRLRLPYRLFWRCRCVVSRTAQTLQALRVERHVIPNPFEMLL